MEAIDLISCILEAHENDNGDGFQLTDNLRIMPQLSYKGKMARTAYRYYRQTKNAGRLYCGILDLKIVLNGKDTEHEKDMIGPTVLNLSQEIVRKIHDGQDPLSFSGLDIKQKEIACCLQAAFAEQELNWGKENFQLWTRFGDPKSIDDILGRSAPRDFLSVFIERCYNELAAGKNWKAVAAEVISPFRGKSSAAGSYVLNPPIHRDEKTILAEFRQSMPCLIHKKRSSLWITPHLQRTADLCESKGPNPAFAITYA